MTEERILLEGLPAVAITAALQSLDALDRELRRRQRALERIYARRGLTFLSPIMNQLKVTLGRDLPPGTRCRRDAQGVVWLELPPGATNPSIVPAGGDGHGTPPSSIAVHVPPPPPASSSAEPDAASAPASLMDAPVGASA
jgi:hypothetical protein